MATGLPRSVSAAPWLFPESSLLDPRLLPTAVSGDELISGLGAPGPRGVDMDGRRGVEQRLHDPPRLLDSVLSREACRLSDQRGVEQDLVRSRPLPTHF